MQSTEPVGDFKAIPTPEKSRTYIFADGEITIKGVSAICVRPSGTHRVNTVAGEKYIVRAGWLAIKIDADAWTF